MRIAVTGASGFVGGAVCRTAAAAGHEVHAFGRRVVVEPGHVGGAPYRSWDITDAPLDDAPPVDAVVHCAGSVTDWAPLAELAAANVTGTVNVLTSFPAPVRFVHVSTASVYDPRVPTVDAGEAKADPARPPRHTDHYGRTKAAAEQQVVSRRPDAVILRPHAVYGPGDPTLLPRVLASVRGGRLLAVGTGRQRVSLTAVAHLAEACLLAATVPDVSGVFNIADAEPVVLDDALRSLLRSRGMTGVRPSYVPSALALPLAAVAEAAARLTGRPPRLTRYAVRHLAVERTLDIGAARKRLGFDPGPTSFDGAENW